MLLSLHPFRSALPLIILLYLCYQLSDRFKVIMTHDEDRLEKDNEIHLRDLRPCLPDVVPNDLSGRVKESDSLQCE